MFATIWVTPARDFAVLAATNAGGDDARLTCDEAVPALVQHEEAARCGGAIRP